MLATIYVYFDFVGNHIHVYAFKITESTLWQVMGAENSIEPDPEGYPQL